MEELDASGWLINSGNEEEDDEVDEDDELVEKSEFMFDCKGLGV